MFLKSEPFTFNGETITLYELSALQRIEYLSYLAREDKSLPSNSSASQVNESEYVARNVRASAMLVAMSLWQGDRKGPTVEEIFDDTFSSWPVTAIGAADNKIKALSGMIPPENDGVHEEKAGIDEEVSAEKS